MYKIQQLPTYKYLIIFFVAGDDKTRVYLLGNPVIWWGNIVFLLIFLIMYTYSSLKTQMSCLLKKERQLLWHLHGSFLDGVFTIFHSGRWAECSTSITIILPYFSPACLVPCCWTTWPGAWPGWCQVWLPPHWVTPCWHSPCPFAAILFIVFPR